MTNKEAINKPILRGGGVMVGDETDREDGYNSEFYSSAVEIHPQLCKHFAGVQ